MDKNTSFDMHAINFKPDCFHPEIKIVFNLDKNDNLCEYIESYLYGKMNDNVCYNLDWNTISELNLDTLYSGNTVVTFSFEDPNNYSYVFLVFEGDKSEEYIKQYIDSIINPDLMNLYTIEIHNNKNKTKDSDSKEVNNMRVVKLEMFMRVDETVMDKLKRVTDHHIEQLIDLDAWPEIEAVYGVKMQDMCDASDYDRLNGFDVDPDAKM